MNTLPIYNLIGALFVIIWAQLNLCMADPVCFAEIDPKYSCYDTTYPFINGRFLKPQSPSKQRIRFKLYTNRNPDRPQYLWARNKTILSRSNFDANGQVAFIIHGFADSSRGPWFRPMVKKLLTKIANVVMVDYSAGARPPSYYQAVSNTRVVGATVATLVETMQGLGVDPGDITVIGHSLGGQVAGYVGDKFQSPKIGRIIGLDPVSNGFEKYEPTVKLDASDAEVVQVIHTNMKTGRAFLSGTGVKERTGLLDFYPNGGARMPGCLTNLCSHVKAMYYFTASIDDTDFLAYPCVSLDDYAAGRCSSCGDVGCNHMGFNATATPSGLFVLDTKRRYPY